MLNSDNSEQKSFIAVHAGAGYHEVNNKDKYLAACRLACSIAMNCLRSGGNALEAVKEAVKSLEDSPCTNAGLGSNLTLEGQVECDAGVMDGASLSFGAVGSVSGVKNPVEVAHKLVVMQNKGLLSLGRIPPSVMVGEGAYYWASQNGLQCVDDEYLITGTARKIYNKYKRKLENVEVCIVNKKNKLDSSFKEVVNAENLEIDFDESRNMTLYQNIHKSSSSKENHSCTSEYPSLLKEENTTVQDVGECCNLQKSNVNNTKAQITDVQDTVGAVCVDHAGNVAAAVSSGGIWLKHMGRLGPAAVYGAGCWAHNGLENNKPGVAVATSGCGEQLMKTLLSKQCGDALQKNDDGILTFRNVLDDCFLKSEFLKNDQEKNAGILGLVVENRITSDEPTNISDKRSIEILWGHTTSSMCLGYMSETHQKPKAMISRLPPACKPGSSLAVQGKVFIL